MNTLCCMSLTLAARIIAALGLSLSILMVNITISEFFGRPRDEFFDAIEPWTFIGLNWIRFINNSNIQDRSLVIFSCFFGYLVLYVLSTSLLAFGTILRKSSLTAPWLYLQIISIADQLIALVLHLTSIPDPKTADRSYWYIPLCSIYLMCTVYFWMVVFTACELWPLNPPRTSSHLDSFNEISDEPIGIIRESRTEKSPSFLSQNIFFEMVTPPQIPEKYDIV